MMDARRILVLAPHTDDAELGCGGTIARFVEEGRQIFVVAFSIATESLPAGWAPDTLRTEFDLAMSALGVQPGNVRALNYPVRRFPERRQDILEELVTLKKELRPDLVLLPSATDCHQDHATIAAEGIRAFRDVSVFGYEMAWNNVAFSGQAFVVLEPGHLEKKWQAIQEYKSQFALGRSYLSHDLLTGLARLRGEQARVAFAECYEVLRLKITVAREGTK